MREGIGLRGSSSLPRHQPPGIDIRGLARSRSTELRGCPRSRDSVGWRGSSSLPRRSSAIERRSSRDSDPGAIAKLRGSSNRRLRAPRGTRPGRGTDQGVTGTMGGPRSLRGSSNRRHLRPGQESRKGRKEAKVGEGIRSLGAEEVRSPHGTTEVSSLSDRREPNRMTGPEGSGMTRVADLSRRIAAGSDKGDPAILTPGETKEAAPTELQNPHP